MSENNTFASFFAQTRVKQSLVYYLVFIQLGAAFSLIGPTLNALAANVSVGLEQISVVFTASALGYMVGSLGSGPLYDKVHGHRFMAASLAATALLLALVPQTRSLWPLVALEFCVGLTTSVMDVGGNAQLVWAHDGHNLGPFMNALHAFFGVGAFLTPLLASAIFARGGDVGLIYYALAITALFVAVLVFMTKGPPRVVVPPTSDSPGRSRYAPLLFMVLTFFFVVAAEGGMGGWLFNYARGYNVSEAGAATLTAGYWGAFTVGRWLGIPIAARFKTTHILIADFGLCVISMALLWLGRGMFWSNWVATIGFGLGMASIFATMLAFAETRIALTGTAAGFFLASGSLGSMIFPLIIGNLVVRSGPDVIPLMLLGAMLAGFIFLLLLFRSPAPAR
jgi:MFS transporter, FHS family, Na+ dependent glucose transporter 1